MEGLPSLKVGTCGWERIYQYAPPSIRKGKSALQVYSKYFSIVEVNSSFYRFHKPETYRKWRQSVPRDFEFTLKCHRDITHTYRMNPKRTVDIFQRVIEDVKRLNAKVLLLQTPASFKATSMTLNGVEDFFASVDYGGVRLCWETRGDSWRTEDIKGRFRAVLERYGITHVTDVLKDDPIYAEDLLYFRLHGLPDYNLRYSYTNDELETLWNRVKSLQDEMGVSEVYIFFNNYQMYRDGQRFLSLVETGRLPESPFGVRSIVDALRPFEDWPATKQELLDKCGEWYTWIEPNRAIKLKEILSKLKDKRYKSVEDILKEDLT